MLFSSLETLRKVLPPIWTLFSRHVHSLHDYGLLQATKRFAMALLTCYMMKQNGWLGFRSASADGRFLQVRRKGTSRLVFFSANFGIWEQWELVEGNVSQPWSRQRMGFRSRNLPQVCIFSVMCASLALTFASEVPKLAHSISTKDVPLHTSVQFVLTVDVQRIGRLATTSIVPHQMAAGEGDLSEHAELQKINNLLITEWSQFVAREKKVC